MKKKICVVTGTRAEYGILRPLIDKLNKDKDLELQLIVTGSHLSPEFGMTYKFIEEDGYKIDEKIEILLSSDSSVGISKSMGLTLISLSESYERLKPDMLIILGDRYETFSAMAAASVAKIPVIHLHGGELTEGAFDDAFRHSMTKMAYLHFAATEEYRQRIIQLGEQPDRVFNLGALGVENVLNMNLNTKKELEKEFNIKLKNYIVVVFHPVTLEKNTSEDQFKDLLEVLDENTELNVVFIKGNADTDGRVINSMIDGYIEKNKERAYSFTSLPVEKYLSFLKNSKALIGNSSSGILEVPSFKIGTINIGDRQKGRQCSKSVIHCGAKKAEIKEAFDKLNSEVFQKKLDKVKNPYEGKGTSKKMIEILKETLIKKEINLKKKFYNIKVEV